VFLRQAAYCDTRSPLYASLCRRFATDARVAAIASDLRWDFPLRLLAGLNYLVLGGDASWDDLELALERHEDFLARFVAEQPVQTNEVARAWALLPGLLSIGAKRLDLLELGASGGLLLGLDRYGYRYDTGTWGVGRPLLTGDGGPPPSLLARGLEVARRRGIDTHPVDVTTAEGARLLEAFVWPDQVERLQRLREAIAVAREDPPELVGGDYVELVPELLAEDTIVFSTVTTVYLDDERYAELAARLRGVRWLSLEAPRRDHDYAGMRLELDGQVLAEHVDYHGTSMKWVSG
jgi:hypothetical protein